jgi:DNA polymerase III subunit beta
VVTDLDRWLETRTTIPAGPDTLESFLIPQDAMKGMTRADKDTEVKVICRGPRKRRELRVVMVCGGIAVESCHPTLEVSEFPEHPVVDGEPTILPARTMESLASVAGCASSDVTRYVLNGVHFNPEDGGRVVATDGRRLACAPAVVPPTPFTLPSATVNVLAHPVFTGNDVHVRLWNVDEGEWISIRSGSHHLVSKRIEGDFPNYRQVIPAFTPELVTFAPEHRVAVIKWLRSLSDNQSGAHLSWEKKGHLTLTQRTASDGSSVLRVPVEIEGKPPLIAFHPRYLADALEIGATLCLVDELSPGICRNPNGRFCVIMPMRLMIPAAAETPKSETTKAA